MFILNCVTYENLSCRINLLRVYECKVGCFVVPNRYGSIIRVLLFSVFSAECDVEKRLCLQFFNSRRHKLREVSSNTCTHNWYECLAIIIRDDSLSMGSPNI